MADMTYQTRKVIKRVAYTAMVVVVTMVLSHIPVWGVNPDYLSALFGQVGMLGFSDMLSGGALSKLAVGGFGVTSIIMAGIVIQLLAVVFPSIEKARMDGEKGRRRFERITFAIAMAFTVFIVAVLMFGGSSQSLYLSDGIAPRVISVVEWLAGTAVIVALAQSVDHHGVGSGPTVILAANIASRIPAELMGTDWSAQQVSGLAVMAVLLVVTMVIAMYMQGGHLPVRIQQTRKSLSGMNSEGVLPMPVSMSSVLPVIYATAVMMLPSLYVMITGNSDGWVGSLIEACTPANWYAPSAWQHWAGLVVYLLLVWGCGAYASRIAFSSPDVANRMRERGDVIAGVAPGEDTETYLERRRRKLYRVGNVMLVLVAVVPDFVLSRFGMSSMSFMGVSLVILVAAFWDLRLRLTGMTKHWNGRYRLFGKEVA